MDDPKLSMFKKRLRQQGASLTTARLTVFKLLDKKEPQSMTSLAKASSGLIDRASLYRTINLFEELGIVNRINIGFKYKLELSDSFNHHHHHLTCVNCGQIINTEDDEQLETLISKLAQRHKFRLTSHQLEIQGQCEACKNLS